MSRLLALAGAVPVEFPVIRIVPLPPPDNLLERLRRADWLVFTSANGLPSLLRQLAVLGADIRALGRARLAAIGPATAQSLWQHGLRVDFIPERFIAEEMAAEFPSPEFKQIVIVRAQETRETLPDLLAARGAGIDILPAYHTAPQAGAPPDLATLDAITFTSSSTVRNFRDRVPGDIRGPRIAGIGPITTATARELGLPVDIEAEEYTIPALVQALVQYFRDCANGSTSQSDPPDTA